jgi:hypothetical protein
MGCSCQCLVKSGRAAPRGVGGQRAAAGCTQVNGWAEEEINGMTRCQGVQKVNCITGVGLELKLMDTH